MSDVDGKRVGRRRWLWWGFAAVALLGSGVAAGWAVTTVLTPADDVLESTPFTYVLVEPGEVGSSIQLNTVAEWTSAPVGTNRADGVVTGVSVEPGGEVSQGTVLYTVDLRPVVVAQGEVPAFRAIGQDAEGPDVAQLQTMLTAIGFYSGPADGEAGAGTVRAIAAWQKSLGVEESGVVELGDVIYVPALPTRVALNSEVIFRGATLSGGEIAVQGLSSAPVFGVPVTDSQAALMPAGSRVEINSPEGNEWVGYAAEQLIDPDAGTIVVTLEGEGDSAICSDQCDQVPVTGEALLQAQIVTVETVAGLVVPTAALVTGADGQVAVIDDDGARISVTVIAAARGMSVVEGVDEGVRVRVPAEGA